MGLSFHRLAVMVLRFNIYQPVMSVKVVNLLFLLHAIDDFMFVRLQCHVLVFLIYSQLPLKVYQMEELAKHAGKHKSAGGKAGQLQN